MRNINCCLRFAMLLPFNNHIVFIIPHLGKNATIIYKLKISENCIFSAKKRRSKLRFFFVLIYF